MNSDFVTRDGGPFSPLAGPCVVGIDLSSKAIDLVMLDENIDQAEWQHLQLDGPNAWERTRSVRDVMPTRSWWDDVYLVAIERPMGFASGALARVQGAVLSCIPDTVTAWDVQPQTWKAALGFKGRGKPGWHDFPSIPIGAGGWPQDAIDAYAVALYARNLNAAGIAAAIGAA